MSIFVKVTTSMVVRYKQVAFCSVIVIALLELDFVGDFDQYCTNIESNRKGFADFRTSCP